MGRCCSGMIMIGNHLRDYEWIVLALCTRNRTWSPATVDAHVFLDCEPESEPARILLHPNLNPQKISRVRVHGIFVLLISDKRVLASSTHFFFYKHLHFLAEPGKEIEIATNK